MTFGNAFWILMLLWLIFGWWAWPDRRLVGGSFLAFVLFALLGWHDFGPPIHP